MHLIPRELPDLMQALRTLQALAYTTYSRAAKHQDYLLLPSFQNVRHFMICTASMPRLASLRAVRDLVPAIAIPNLSSVLSVRQLCQREAIIMTVLQLSDDRFWGLKASWAFGAFIGINFGSLPFVGGPCLEEEFLRKHIRRNTKTTKPATEKRRAKSRKLRIA